MIEAPNWGFFCTVKKKKPLTLLILNIYWSRFKA